MSDVEMISLYIRHFDNPSSGKEHERIENVCLVGFVQQSSLSLLVGPVAVV